MTPVPVVDAVQATQWDERATASGVPSRVLMETAGRAVASIVARAFGDALHRGVLLVAGRGNNGGDGWVAARALRAGGVRVVALETGGKTPVDCAANRALALESGVELLEPNAPTPAIAVVIDALLGTGASGAPRDDVALLAGRINDLGAPIVAVDGPTGLDLTTGQAHGPVRAQVTVTFGGLRRGHLLARDWCGEVIVTDIGFPSPDPAWPQFVDDEWARVHVPRFGAGAHKGDRGRVLIVGGAPGMAGAVLHSARAAFAAGAGIVKVAASDDTVKAVQAALPDALAVAIRFDPKCEAALVEALEWADALVLGPGLGREPGRQAFVGALLEAAAKRDRPAVVDADALHVGGDAIRRAPGKRILTPHLGEFRTAFPELAAEVDQDRFAATSHAAETARSIVLLKGVPTIVAGAGDPLLVIGSGGPALATGGSGDLLCGFVATFLAQGLIPAEAAALGAHALGRAGELAAERRTARAARPIDVLAACPSVWRSWDSPQAYEPPVLLNLHQPLGL